MDQEISSMAQATSREIWNQARRKAFWQRVSGTLGIGKGYEPLVSFDDVQQKLRLNQHAYRGLQQVPLAQIIGSVGRYHDFTRTFLPLTESDSARWRRVAELQMEAGLPPIDLYKVGDAYFVRDGNHRVSVARQLGMETIEAYVWEYETATGGISAEADVEELVLKEEHRAFLDRTRLGVQRPEAKIKLTEPGMYPALELEIELYRRNLEQIDGGEVTYEEAAATWYDLLYSLGVEVIRDSGALDLFPGRTEADLYVWVSRHRRDFQERYGGTVSLRDAVTKIATDQLKTRPGPVGRMVRSVASLMSSLAGDHAHDPDEMIVPPSETEPFGKLLAELQTVEPQMSYAGQRGEDWRAWRTALRSKVYDLLGMDYTPSENVFAEESSTSLISGVERTKLLIEAADGMMLPAYIMRPAEVDEQLPALLFYAGHGTICETAGLLESPHKSNALALAQAGYVTLTIEARGIGELGQVDHQILDSVARLVGRTWLAMVLEDGLRGLDYLRARGDVCSDCLGVAGFGLGGGLALYTAALDERVRAVVVQNYLGGGIDPLIVHGHGCDFVPGLWRYARMSDVARLIAPRPVLYVYPRDRSTTQVARAWFDMTRPAYEVFRCPDRTNFIEPSPSIRFFRQVTQRWFDRWLVEEPDTSVLLTAPRE